MGDGGGTGGEWPRARELGDCLCLAREVDEAVDASGGGSG